MPMTTDPEFVRQRLERLRSELGTRLDLLRRELRRESRLAEPDGPGRTIQRENNEALAELEGVTARHLQDVQHALDWFLTGKLGICESCGHGIDVERLASVPEATTCGLCAGFAAAPVGSVRVPE